MVDIQDIITIAMESGAEVEKIYRARDYWVQAKGDDSPLTLADKVSHDLITRRLKELYPEIPIVSEEGDDPIKGGSFPARYWLVDPLDGTKEFINRRDEFSVNIALVQESYPRVGVIYAPVSKDCYFAVKDEGAYRVSEAGEKTRLQNRVLGQDSDCTVIVSRSHLSSDTSSYLDLIRRSVLKVRTISVGSSLKFCTLAEGNADIYPRFGPTMEWDTAAGQIILEEAGGSVVNAETGDRFKYDKAGFKNGSFVASSNNFWGDVVSRLG